MRQRGCICGGKRVQGLTGSESVKSVERCGKCEKLGGQSVRVGGRMGAGRSGGGEDLGRDLAQRRVRRDEGLVKLAQLIKSSGADKWWRGSKLKHVEICRDGSTLSPGQWWEFI